MGDDLHTVGTGMLGQVIGHLLQTILAGLQVDHLGIGGHAGQQAGGIGHPGIDEQHIAAAGSWGTVGNNAGADIDCGRRLARHIEMRGNCMAGIDDRISDRGDDRGVNHDACFQRHDQRWWWSGGTCAGDDLAACDLGLALLAPPHTALLACKPHWRAAGIVCHRHPVNAGVCPLPVSPRRAWRRPCPVAPMTPLAVAVS